MAARRSLTRPQSIGFFTPLLILVLLALVGGCPPGNGGQPGNGGPPDDNGTPGPDNEGIPEDLAAFIALDTSAPEGQASGTLSADTGPIELPGLGTVAVIQSGDAKDVVVTLKAVELTPAALQAVSDTRDPFTPVGEAMQVIITATQDALPDYLIVQLPAPDDQARMLVTGYLDFDTLTPAWVPVRGSYDADTGMLSAAIGIDELRPVNGSATSKSAAAQQGQSLTYTGTVTAGVGTQQFETDVILLVDEPTEALEVTAGDAPIPLRARIGLRFTNITNQPLENLTVDSDFGKRVAPVSGASTCHRGVDFRAAIGTNVYAVGDGTVTNASCQNTANCGIGAGFYVVIDHGNGEISRYFHLTIPGAGTAVNCTDEGVCVGDQVRGGQLIATSSNSGNVSGPHLHFEIHEDGVAVDPEQFFNGGTATLTFAVALDLEIQSGTEETFTVGRSATEVPLPGDLFQYVNTFELDEVIAGERNLNFVLLQPAGTLEILAQVPITIRPKFTSLTPDQGRFEDFIVAQGLGFDFKNPPVNVVDLSDIGRYEATATPSRVTYDTLDFMVPQGAVFGPVKVTVNGVDSQDMVEFSPFVTGRFFNDSDETDEPVDMDVEFSPHPGCNELVMTPSSLSVGPGGNGEITVRAGDSFISEATWTDFNDPSELRTEVFDFFCDGDDTGTPVEHRGVETDFSIYTGGGGGFSP